MLKYSVHVSKLKLVGANDNTAVNGRGLAVSPDGKQVALAGAGGWRSKVDTKGIGGVAIWGATAMETRNGQVESVGPQGVALHPVLPSARSWGWTRRGRSPSSARSPTRRRR